MNIFVCVKQVPDTEAKISPAGDKTYVDTSAVKWIMNPFDEYAVEEAVQIKEKNDGSKVILVRVGDVQKKGEVLRTALAMGCDEAILVQTDQNLDSYTTAKALKEAINKFGTNPDIILTGKIAVDGDCSQVPSLLAQMMDLPSVGVACDINLDGTNLTVKREIEGGAVEVYDVALPALVSCNKGLNTPRYPALPKIMKAKKMPMAQYSLADLGITDADRRVIYSDVSLPEAKPPGKKFDATDEATQAGVIKEVAGLLRTEAKVI